MSNKNYEAYRIPDPIDKKWEGYSPSLSNEISSDLEDLLDELNASHTVSQDLVNEFAGKDIVSKDTLNDIKIMRNRIVLSIQYVTEILGKNNTIREETKEC